MGLTSRGEHLEQDQLLTARPRQERAWHVLGPLWSAVWPALVWRAWPERRLEPGHERAWKARSSVRSWT